MTYDEEVFDGPLTLAQAEASFEEVQKRRIRSDDSYLKLFTYPNSSVSVKDISSVLQQHERQGWIAEIVICDYMDILAPMDAKQDKIERVNQTWKAMRALSQARHCLVVTASQTSKESYEARTISRKHGTEFRGKFDHVTAVIGISQEEEEKERGLMRLNVFNAREMDFSVSRQVHVAGSLALASPAMHSAM